MYTLKDLEPYLKSTQTGQYTLDDIRPYLPKPTPPAGPQYNYPQKEEAKRQRDELEARTHAVDTLLPVGDAALRLLGGASAGLWNVAGSGADYAARLTDAASKATGLSHGDELSPTAQSIREAAKWFSGQGQAVSDYVLQGREPTLLDAVAQGMGSSAAFMVPGMAVGRMAQASGIIPRVLAYAATKGGLEAITEGGSVFGAQLDKGATPKEAHAAALRTELLQFPINFVSDAIGDFIAGGGAGKEALDAAGKELVKQTGKGGFAKAIKDFAESAARPAVGRGIGEFAQESFQGPVSDKLSERKWDGTPWTWGDVVKALPEIAGNIPETMLKEGVPAFISAALIGAGEGIYRNRQAKKPQTITQPVNGDEVARAKAEQLAIQMGQQDQATQAAIQNRQAEILNEMRQGQGQGQLGVESSELGVEGQLGPVIQPTPQVEPQNPVQLALEQLTSEGQGGAVGSLELGVGREPEPGQEQLGVGSSELGAEEQKQQFGNSEQLEGRRSAERQADSESDRRANDETIIKAVIKNGANTAIEGENFPYPDYYSAEWTQSVIDRMTPEERAAAIETASDPNVKGYNFKLRRIISGVLERNPIAADEKEYARRKEYIAEFDKKERERKKAEYVEEQRIKDRDYGLVKAIKATQKQADDRTIKGWLEDLLTEEEKNELSAERKEIVKKFPFGKERNQAYREFAQDLLGILMEKQKKAQETKWVVQNTEPKKETPATVADIKAQEETPVDDKTIPSGSKLKYDSYNVEYNGKQYKIDAKPWEVKGHRRLYLKDNGKDVGYYDANKNEFVSTYGNSSYADVVKKGFESNIHKFYEKSIKPGATAPAIAGDDVSGSVAPASPPGKETSLNTPSDPLAHSTQGMPSEESAGGEMAVIADKTISQEEPKVKTPSRVAAEEIAARLSRGEGFKNNRELFDVTDKAFGGTQTEGKYDVKDAYDALELGVNLYIKEKGFNPSATKSVAEAKAELERITAEILNLIPTQANRTEEQNEFQQFSTPPNISYVANWVLGAGKGDIVLEPSAGIGGLAVFAQNSGAEIVANELSQRRAELLREMGFSKVFTENAEQIHNILPDDVKPTKVIMNPPFSSTAGRIEGKRDTKNATAHVEQALKRLADGGRAVLILGKGMASDAKAFTSWWSKIKGEYNVRANVEIAGSDYKKYGTTFGCVMVVVDKTGATPADGTITGKFDTVADVMDALVAARESAPTVVEKQNQNKTETKQENTNETSEIFSDEQLVDAILNHVNNFKPENDSLPVYTELVSREWVENIVSRMDEEAKNTVTRAITKMVDRVGRKLDANTLRNTITNILNDTEKKKPVPSVDRKERSRRKAHVKETMDKKIKENKATAEEHGSSSSIEATKEEKPAATPKKEGIEVTQKTKEEIISDKAKTDETADDKAVYDTYTPAKIKIPGAVAHPADLVQSSAMAAMDPPDPTYTPRLPKELITSGKLSEAQLEAIVYAGQSFEQTIGDGSRRGFFIGDGTGVGKGREISGILMDQLAQGHGKGKAVWISMSSGLLQDAKRDWAGLDNNPDDIFFQQAESKNAKTDIKRDKGILFTVYTTIREADRMKQLTDWLGEGFDGVIALDECHNANNAIDTKGTRGTKSASKQALAVQQLIAAFPKARILYVSATGATEVSNLSMLGRLGLWGKGTAFPDVHAFVNQVTKGGTAAMELVARDMKAMGVYIARSLSHRTGKYGCGEDATFETLEHKLEDHQKMVYDRIAEAWQVVLENIEEAIKMIAGTDRYGNAPSAANRKLSAGSQFWSAHQRAFNQIITSMQTPAVINAIERDLKNGYSVVIQLTNTNEADQKRALEKLGEDESLDNFDATPRDILIGFLNNSFPVQQYEEKQDDKGNIVFEPVMDSNGNPVLNKEAVALRDKMISDIEKIAFPDSPIDMIINAFGSENVAEITGRTQRVVQKDGKAVLEKRPKAARESDKQDFQDGKKRILIFSEAGGTGASYHADKNVKNQQKRKHYLLQPGWKSAAALQGLGRTLRSNQAHMPVYSLVTTDLPGQKRFISTIARRLEQLGALTTGERKSATQGLFSERDNLESTHANFAMVRLLDQITRCGVGDMSASDVFAQLGFSNLIDDNRKLNTSKIPEMRQFLNRLLSLKYDAQQEVFSEFEKLLDEEITLAIERGTIDVGTETLRADSIEVLQERTVYTDEKTGSKTQYIEIETGQNQKPVPFAKVKDAKFFTSNKTGRIVAVYDLNSTMTDSRTGRIHQQYMALSVDPAYRVKTKADTIDNTDYYTPLSEKEAKEIWAAQSKELPKMKKERKHIISGALLPIWNLLEGKPQVLRIKSNDGRSFLGRIIPQENLALTLKKLGVTYESSKKITAKEIIEEIKAPGAGVKLANDWVFKISRVNREKRIELVVPKRDALAYNSIFTDAGLKKEMISWETRLFVPVNEMSETIIDEVLKISPVMEVVGKDLMSRAAEDLNEGIDDFNINDYAGHTIKDLNTENNPFIGESEPFDASILDVDVKFKDANTEARYQKAKKGVQKDSLIKRLGELIKGITHGFKSDFPDIMGSHFDKAREILRKLNRKRGVSVHDAILTLRNTVKEMDTEDYGLFSRKRILDDLMYQKEVNPGSALPYGFTDKQLDEEHERITEVVKDNPRIQRAIKWEMDIIKKINDGMIEAANAIDWKSLSDCFNNPYYYRHVVLEYANAAANGTKKGLKAPDGRGYLKQRRGSEKDISANYIQAMGEVRAMQLQDIETMKALKEIKDNYDIAGELKVEAFKKNDKLFREALFEKGIEITGNVLDAEDWAHKRLGELNKRQSMALATLFEMAEEGNLPAGNFKKLVEAMSEAGHTEALSDSQRKELNKYLGWLAGLRDDESGTIQARTYFKYTNAKKQEVKDTLGAKFVRWQDLLTSDYVEWHPFQNRLVFSAHSVAEHIVNQAIEDGMTELNIPLDKISIVHALGGHRQTWAIPKSLADTLDKIGTPTERSMIGKIAKEITTQWKEWVLLGPTRLIKYNIRNITGDADAVLAVNPSSFKYTPQAFQELANVYVKGQTATGELAEFSKRGGPVGAMHIQELGDKTSVMEFKHLLDQGEAGLRNMPKKFWHSFWTGSRKLADFRENILRYATYLSYLEQMTDVENEETGYKDPRNWGASKKNEVAALDDIRDKAYKMANELLGAYNQVSETGQQLRDAMIPFYSWMEVNLRRYAQIFRNGMDDGNLGNVTKRVLAGKAMKAPLYAWKAANTTFKVSLFWGLIQVFNRLVMGDDDDELDPNVKGRPHITLGRNTNGNIIYFDRIGAFADVLDWFALDSAYTDIKDILNGHQSIGDYLTKMAQAPFSKLINGLNPLIKTPMEVVSGKKYFPDAFNPRTIRDVSVYVAETLGLSQEFIAVTGRPSRGYGKSRLGNLFVYSANPDEAAYWWILDKKRQFQENVLGVSGGSGATSTRGLAMMNYKKALHFGDKKAQKKYLAQFIQYDGTRKGYDSSMRSMHPLGGLSERDRARFLRWLTPEDRKYLEKAGKYLGAVMAQRGQGDEDNE